MKIIFAFIICMISFSCKKDYTCNCTFDHKTEASIQEKDAVTFSNQSSSTPITAKDRKAAEQQCEQNNGVTVDKDSLPSVGYRWQHTRKTECGLQ